MNRRYSRQEIFQPIGKSGQKKISEARLAVLGCGALGSVSSEMLVRAGIGFTRIVDRDFVEYSNLQRQGLYNEKHAQNGIPKAAAAVEILSQINSEVTVEGLVEDITSENITNLLEDIDLVIDGSDNFELRFLLNDYSNYTGKPWLYGAVLGSFGLSFPVIPDKTPCLRCYFKSPPTAGMVETCESSGIIAPIVHVVSAYQVNQALRLLTGAPVSDSIFQADIWENDWRKIGFDLPVEDCICCVKKNYEFLNNRCHAGAVRLCGRKAFQVTPLNSSDFNLVEFASRFKTEQIFVNNPYLVRMELDELELTLFRSGRAIIKGTDDPGIARSLYSKYVGC